MNYFLNRIKKTNFTYIHSILYQFDYYQSNIFNRIIYLIKSIPMKNQFDYIDKQILSKLQLDARKAYSQIAEELKISNSLVHQRVKKLTKEGVLKNATFIFDEKKLGYKTKSYTGIRLREARFAKSVMKELTKIDEIVECNYVSGNYAIFILIFALDNEHLQKILYEHVHLINGVAGTDTFICFDAGFRRNVPIQQ